MKRLSDRDLWIADQAYQAGLVDGQAYQKLMHKYGHGVNLPNVNDWLQSGHCAGTNRDFLEVSAPHE